MDAYATHLRILVRYALNAPIGSHIAEMGCGFYSTLVLNEIAKARGLHFTVYYQDRQWQKKVEPYAEAAEFVRVEDWEKWELDKPTHLVLLDNEQMVKDRYKQLPKLVKHAQFIAVHDADTYSERNIDLFGTYNVVEIEKTLSPQTAIIKGIDLKLKNAVKSAVVCVYSQGGDFDSHCNNYVKNLFECVKKNIKHVDFDFFCLTDVAEEINVKGVRCIPLESDLKGWHSKFEVFREELWVNYRNVLYLDLDTIVTAGLDGILTDNADFMMLSDLLHPESLASGVMLFNPKDKRFLYENAIKHRPRADEWDQRLIEQWCEESKLDVMRFQDFYNIASFKKEITKEGKSPEDFHMVCFHGRPRPHEVRWRLPRANKSGDEIPYKSVEKWCDGETVYIIGGGPSLKGVDLKRKLKGKTCLAINGSFELGLAETLFFGDDVWFNRKRADVLGKKRLKRIYTTSGIRHERVVNVFPSNDGISDDPTKVAWNLNSGFAALNLALLGGAKKIVLLGFDMCKAEDGESNWYENIRYVCDNTYSAFLSRQETMAKEIKEKFPEVEILNANPESKLDVFKKVTLKEATKERQKAGAK